MSIAFKTVEYYDEYVYSYRRESQNSITNIASFRFCSDLLSILEMNLNEFDKYLIKDKTRNMLLLNMQTLISVVLFHYYSYTKNEKEILKNKILNLRNIFFIDKNYRYLMRKKEKFVGIFIKLGIINTIGWLWFIKKNVRRS